MVRVEGAAAPPSPSPSSPAHGPLPVTGAELFLVPLAILAVAVGGLLRRVAR